MKRKSITSLFIAFILMITSLPVVAFAGDAIESGTCGTCVWSIDSDKVMTISSGELENWGEDYDSYLPPWKYAETDEQDISSVQMTGIVKAATGHNMFELFSSAETIDVSKLDTSNVSSMKFMFHQCESVKTLDVSNFCTSAVTDMSGMFSNCNLLESINLRNFETENVTDMTEMFYRCKSLKNIDVSSFDTSNVTSMMNMFGECESLESIDLSNFVTKNLDDEEYVTDGMLAYCTNLKSVKLPEDLTRIGGAFCKECSSLTRLTIPENVESIDSDAMYYCENLKSIAIPDKVTSIGSYAFRGCSRLTDIYYSGSKEQWDSISIDEGNENLEYVNIHFNEYPGDPDNPDNPDDPDDSDYYVLGRDNNSFLNSGEHFFNIKKVVFAEKNYLSDALESEGFNVIVDKNEYRKYKKKASSDNRIALSGIFFGNNSAYVEVSDIHGATNYTSFYADLERGDFFQSQKMKDYKYSEWNGGCFGIAYSSILHSEGRLKNILDDSTWYYFLGAPKENETNKLRDVIMYYQMLQNRDDLCFDYITYGDQRLWYSYADRKKDLKDFLELLVNEAKRSQELKKPFIFSYRYPKGAHSVVVCGYKFDRATSQHLIQIWDCNKSLHTYSELKVSNDYSDFSFTDANGHHVEEIYKDLVFHGIDTLDNYPTIASSGSSKRSVKMLNAMKGETISEPVSRLSIPAYENCTIINDQGKVLKYDDGQYSATMNVYDEKDIISENPTIEFKVDKSSSFTVTDMDKDVFYQIATDIGSDYYGVQVKGADRIVINESEIVVEGEAYDYTLMQGKENNDFDFVRVAGNATGSVKSSLTDEYILTMDTASDSTSVIVSANGEEQNFTINDYVDKVTVNNTDYKISIDTNVVKPADPTDPVDPSPVDSKPAPIVTPTVPVTPAEIVDLPKVKISKPKAAKKSATIKWKKVSKKNLKKIAKIEIQYSLDKNFKTGVISKYAKAKKTSLKIKKLTSKKTYYVRIRAYKKSGGVVHVSKWSSRKKVKVK